MTWEPIGPGEFHVLLDDAIGELDSEYNLFYARHAMKPVHLKCERPAGKPGDSVFAVARAENAYLIYDDVEDDFAVGAPDTDGILRNWRLYGSLWQALQGLEKAEAGH